MGIAAAAAVALGTAAGMAAAWMWLVLVVLIGFHELGHYLAARRFRYPVREVVVGVGPCLARYEHDDLRLELRLIPLAGWVGADTADRGRFQHRRGFWFAAAGPLASALLGLVLLIGGSAATFGASAVTGDLVVFSAQTTLKTAAEVPVAAVGAVIQGLTSGDDRGGEAQESAEGTDGGELSSVVGVTKEMGDDIEEGGLAMVAIWAAVMSASIAGFNLIPAFGLDGHRMVEAVIEDVTLRRRKVGQALRLVSLGVSVVLGLALGILVVQLLVSDVAGLL
jgi:membrane-associated protease RseP (regulator of RpoE activity)